jgi:imidazolonepropionase-like amidohydrolase
MLCEAGMAPIEALRAATSGAADHLGAPELGRLVAGSAADAVAVRGDPTERLGHAPEVVATVCRGALHTRNDLLAGADGCAGDLEGDPWGAQFRAHAPAGG